MKIISLLKVIKRIFGYPLSVSLPSFSTIAIGSPEFVESKETGSVISKE